MMNHAVAADVTLGHYVAKGDAQLSTPDHISPFADSSSRPTPVTRSSDSIAAIQRTGGPLFACGYLLGRFPGGVQHAPDRLVARMIETVESDAVRRWT